MLNLCFGRLRTGALWLLATVLMFALGAPGALADKTEYDSDGRVIQVTHNDDEIDYYVYDQLGNLIEIRKSDGTVVPAPPDSTPPT